MSLFVAMSVKRIATHNKHRNRIITLHVLDLTFNDFPEKKNVLEEMYVATEKSVI